MAQTKCLPGMLDKDVETVVSLIRALSLLCLFLQIFFLTFYFTLPQRFNSGDFESIEKL